MRVGLPIQQNCFRGHWAKGKLGSGLVWIPKRVEPKDEKNADKALTREKSNNRRCAVAAKVIL